MIQAGLAPLHTQNVERMTRIEERIIGIDGNGTGREGAVQRIEKKLAEASSAQKAELNKMAEFMVDVRDGLQVSIDSCTTGLTSLNTALNGSVKTKTLWTVAASIAGVILTMAGALLSGWVQHRMGWK